MNNFTNSTLLSVDCPLDPLAWSEDYLLGRSVFTLLAIVLNMASCPFTILMNVFVIVLVKTKHQLQTKNNILLACLAGTDLLVGAIVQPSFAVAEIFVLKGLSLKDFCRNFLDVGNFFFIPFSASLFHLALLSAERYAAMKYSLRYQSIVTSTRIKSAVIFSWLIAISSALRSLGDFKILQLLVGPIYIAFRIFTLITIVYCHVSVYIVTRRHEKQIQAAQVSPEAVANFLKEKKAFKTTTIIIGVLIMCYIPLVISGIVSRFVPRGHFVSVVLTLIHPLLLSLTLLNSICNPLIYCFRNKTFRKAFVKLLV